MNGAVTFACFMFECVDVSLLWIRLIGYTNFSANEIIVVGNSGNPVAFWILSDLEMGILSRADRLSVLADALTGGCALDVLSHLRPNVFCA